MTTELKQRFLSSALFLAVLALVVLFAHHPMGRWGLVGIVGILSVWTLHEFIAMVQWKEIILPKFLLLLPAFFLPFLWQIDGLWVLVTFALLIFSLFCVQLAQQREPLISISIGVLGFAYVALSLSLLIPITMKAISWALFLVAVTKSADIAGLFIGRRFGKHALCPRISPKKTWEGAIAGLIASTAMSSLFSFMGWVPLSLGSASLLGLLFGVLSEIGDLSGSLLKRDVGIKDSGKGLPGLGGLFDIVDSMLWTTPFLYFYLRIKA